MGIVSTIRRALTGRNGNRPPLHASAGGGLRKIRGQYAAAADDADMIGHWGRADNLDADAANSLPVRKKLRERSRLERGSNAYAAGMILTHANIVVGVGPTLRMQTASTGFNAMVEAEWQRWCDASGLLRKLRTMHMAKTTDGEAFGQFGTNPAIDHQVKLDLNLIECDQVSSPYLPFSDPQRVDGVWFDKFGNPTAYDILPYHPGGVWGVYGANASKIDAQWIVHWFRADRPGQHRGIPETTPALNSFAQGRRWREAVIAAAETAADFAAVMEMPVPPSGEPDVAQPFSTMPIERRLFVATPAGAKMTQLKAEQPSTGYDVLNRSLLCEQGRPLGMSYVIAALDSSASSFSGGKLDQLNYQVVVDVDRAECETAVLNRVFSLWFAEAVLAFGWSVSSVGTPKHDWDWPAMPQIDNEKTANARKTALSCGSTRLGRIYAEDGLDFEDEVAGMAAEYGVTVDEMRQKLFDSNFQKSGGAPGVPGDKPAPDVPAKANGNGTYKISAYNDNHDEAGRFAEGDSGGGGGGSGGSGSSSSGAKLDKAEKHAKSTKKAAEHAQENYPPGHPARSDAESKHSEAIAKVEKAAAEHVDAVKKETEQKIEQVKREGEKKQREAEKKVATLRKAESAVSNRLADLQRQKEESTARLAKLKDKLSK